MEKKMISQEQFLNQQDFFTQYTIEEIEKITGVSCPSIAAKKYIADAEKRKQFAVDTYLKERRKIQTDRLNFSLSFLFSILAIPIARKYSLYTLIGYFPILGKLFVSLVVGGFLGSMCWFLGRKKESTIACMLGLSYVYFFADGKFFSAFFFCVPFSIGVFLIAFSFGLPFFFLALWALSRFLPTKSKKEIEESQEIFSEAFEAASKMKKKHLKKLIERNIQNASARKILEKVEDADRAVNKSMLNIFDDSEKEKSASGPDKKENIETMELPLMVGEIYPTREKKYLDFSKVPHGLIGGCTGTGKSNALNHIITSLLPHEDVELVLIDPKKVEFYRYRELKKVVYADYDGALDELRNVKEEMDRRDQILVKHGVEKISRLKEKLPYIFVVIDEVAEFDSRGGTGEEKERNREVLSLISKIARIGRNKGIVLICATQRPTCDALPMQARSNMALRFCYGVSSSSESDIILGVKNGGGEKLEKRGEAILKVGKDLFRIQTPLWNEANAKKLIASLAKKNHGDDSTLPEGVEYLEHGQAGQLSLREALEAPKKEELRDAPSGNLIPSQKGDLEAFFVNGRELKNMLGRRPESLGFEKTRRSLNGRNRVWGYWVRNI